MILGVEAAYYTYNLRYNFPSDTSVDKAKNYGGSAFLRQYVPLLKNFYFFGQGAVGYTNTNSSRASNNQTYNKSNGWGIAADVYPGVAYAVSKKFHIEAGLNNLLVLSYGHSKSEAVNSGTTTYIAEGNSFNISTSLGSNGGFSIGFRLML